MLQLNYLQEITFVYIFPAQKYRPTINSAWEVPIRSPTCLTQEITKHASRQFLTDDARITANPLYAELNSSYHLLALLGARHIFHVSGIRVNQFNLRV